MKELYVDGSAKGDVAERIQERLPQLLRGLMKNDGASICEAVSKLVGLGNGLTPDMDDFLFGMLYAFQEKGKPPAYRALETAVKGSLHGTTVFSREFLKCALRGAEFEAVTGVLRDMGNREKIEKLVGVGHSSGSSICVGILTAVQSIGVRI